MRKTTLKYLFLTACIALLSIASTSVADAGGDGRIDVLVSIPPQAYFVGRVGGDRVDVHVMVEPGRSPHTFEPTPKQMVELAQADLYFKIGLPFETVLLGKIAGAGGGLRIVDSTDNVRRRMIGGHKHEHGHADGTADPHIWLNPYNVGVMARAMARALGELDPKNARYYERNAKLFSSDLGRLARRISSRLKPYAQRPFYVYHPAFGYFADAFGIVQVPIELGGKEPGGSELVRLIKSAKAHGARTIFVEPEFSKARAQMVARAIGGSIVVLDPLARDYIVNLESIAQKISQALAVEK